MTQREVTVEIDERGVGLVEFANPPVNFFDVDLIRQIVDTYAELDGGTECRSIVLASSGNHFCAGADFGGASPDVDRGEELYDLAAQLLRYSIPVVVAVQGRAVGGGLGLAMTGDFRVATPDTKFVCNFARLGIHHGFGLSVTLPATVGRQRASELLYTGGAVDGMTAERIGLCDRVVPADQLREAAFQLAHEIAKSAPLAVRSIRRTMRGDMADAVAEATRNELREQRPLFLTSDFAEGVAAARERRDPTFTGH